MQHSFGHVEAKDAAQARAGMNGLYEMAHNDEFERLDESGAYSSHKFDFIRREVDAYAYDVLAKADAKIRALGQKWLDIPKIYRPYAIDDAPPLAPVKAKGRKVDFTKLDDSKLNPAFTGVSKGSLAVLAHRASAAGQVDELLDYLKKNGGWLGAKELLYRPDAESSSLAEIIASRGKLGRVMTAENWKDDPDGIDKLEEALGANIVAAQMPEGRSVESVKWEIESSAVRKGRKPIRIGVRAK